MEDKTKDEVLHQSSGLQFINTINVYNQKIIERNLIFVGEVKRVPQPKPLYKKTLQQIYKYKNKQVKHLHGKRIQQPH